MTIALSAQTLLTAAAILGALAAVLGYLRRLFGWFQRQEKQDREIRALKQEQRLLTCGVLACLKGLREQGCNGPVTEAIKQIEDYMNSRAHR